VDAALRTAGELIVSADDGNGSVLSSALSNLSSWRFAFFSLSSSLSLSL
jgi:hypothetical protein